MSRFRLALAKWGVQIGGMSERTTSAQQARAERVTRAAAASLGRRAARAIGRAPLLTVYILAREAAHCALWNNGERRAELKSVEGAARHAENRPKREPWGADAGTELPR